MDTVPCRRGAGCLVDAAPAGLLSPIFASTARACGTTKASPRSGAAGIAEPRAGRPGDIQPPLYYYVVAAFRAACRLERVGAALPSAWFATVTALMAAGIAPGELRACVALLAALFTALHPLVLYYGRKRMYAQLTAAGRFRHGYLLVRLAGSDNRRGGC